MFRVTREDKRQPLKTVNLSAQQDTNANICLILPNGSLPTLETFVFIIP